jgi:hypothetical protein
LQLTRSGLLPANIRWRVAEGADSPETTDGPPREVYIWGAGGPAEADVQSGYELDERVAVNKSNPQEISTVRSKVVEPGASDSPAIAVHRRVRVSRLRL